MDGNISSLACQEQYNNELYEQTHPYEMWINEYESADKVNETDTTTRLLNVPEFVVFVAKGGETIKGTSAFLAQYFIEEPDVDILYGDEDLIDEQTRKRSDPWFKPEYSPDTLLSTNYFGSLVAIRRQVVLDFITSKFWEKDERFDFIRRAGIDKEIGCVTRIEFGRNDYEAIWTMLRMVCRKHKAFHIDRILYHGYSPERFSKKILHLNFDLPEDMLCSIIIPSKDNPTMLRRCIESINKHTKDINYEIIVVDNGSNDEHRLVCFGLSKELSFRYIYEAMQFNFSRMCNIGARASKGQVLLFLNDDITIHTDHWLKTMAAQALQPHTGAVGAKLYYPGGTVIQHDGITNMCVGPAHKLGGMDDGAVLSLYHGRNVADVNVAAVTGAALAVSRDKFIEVKGFSKDLAVAYNDVDLCFSLLERGYYNIVRNDVTLYHHESVSRGKDEAPEKKKRLERERALLYDRHTRYYHYDPFYSKNLVQYRLDADYNIEYRYPFECPWMLSKVNKIQRVSDTSMPIARKLMRKGPVCLMNIDQMEFIYVADDVAVDTPRALFIKGWAAMTEKNMCEYDRFIILQNVNNTKAMDIEASVFNFYREDVAGVIPMQQYPALVGFTARILEKELSPGTYQIGCLFVNKLTGSREVVLQTETVDIG